MTSQPGLRCYGKLHASLQTMATAKSDKDNDCKDELIQPYMFEPNKGDEEEASDDSSDDSSSVESDFDEEFERANAWRTSSLNWCKCGNCTLMVKAIESFCCHEKSLEYDEYDDLLSSSQNQGLNCITSLLSFTQNMLSKEVLAVDVSQYLEENWPVGDDELEQTQKLFRHVAYRRCSRWVFTILGKKNRRVFPSCVYKCTRNTFASPSGLYTHFKFSK